MPWLTMLFSTACMGYGLFTLLMSSRRPRLFPKLEKMKATLGEQRGILLHLVFYGFLPLGVGLFLLMQMFFGAASL